MEYRKYCKNDIDELMTIREKMLREVNGLDQSTVFDQELYDNSKEYFQNGEHCTMIAFDGKNAVSVVTLCYIYIIPTYSHQSGKRAHLTNVYTVPEYRRQGISEKLVRMVIDEAKANGATEISLDATADGRPLYEKCEFKASNECMVLTFD